MALVPLLLMGADVLLVSRTMASVEVGEASLEEAVETVDATDEIDTVVPVAVDAEVAVEVGRTLVRVAPYTDLQVASSTPFGQQSVLLSVPG